MLWNTNICESIDKTASFSIHVNIVFDRLNIAIIYSLRS